MNERIALLINRATTVEKGPPNWDLTANTVITTFDKEKFAVLLVQECFNQISKVEEHGDAHLGGGNFYDGTRLCRDAIKQHFGIEE